MNEAAEILKLSNYTTTDRVLSIYILQFTVYSIIWLGTKSKDVQESKNLFTQFLLF